MSPGWRSPARVSEEAAETEQRCTTLAGEFEAKKTAILDSAREAKQRHFQDVLDGSLRLAAAEDPNETED